MPAHREGRILLSIQTNDAISPLNDIAPKLHQHRIEAARGRPINGPQALYAIDCNGTALHAMTSLPRLGTTGKNVMSINHTGYNLRKLVREYEAL